MSDAKEPAPLTRFLADRDAPCAACGFNLRGLRAAFCPECGAVVPRPSARELAELENRTSRRLWCRKCGYDLHAVTGAVCPECGESAIITPTRGKEPRQLFGVPVSLVVIAVLALLTLMTALPTIWMTVPIRKSPIVRPVYAILGAAFVLLPVFACIVWGVMSRRIRTIDVESRRIAASCAAFLGLLAILTGMMLGIGAF